MSSDVVALAFSNKSHEGETSRGGTGKLNDEQTKERFKLHAQRYAYGRPTIQSICDYWMKTYGISISYHAEKEWAWRNETRIRDHMNTMVDAGELQIVVTDASFINTLKVSGEDTAKTIRAVEKELIHVLNQLDTECDPYKALGTTYKDFLAMPETEREVVSKEVEFEEKRNRLRLRVLDTLSCILRDHKTVLLKTVDTAKDLFDGSKIKEKKQQMDIEREVNKRLRPKVAEDFDRLDVEVDDETRDQVLKGGKS